MNYYKWESSTFLEYCADAEETGTVIEQLKRQLEAFELRKQFVDKAMCRLQKARNHGVKLLKIYDSAEQTEKMDENIDQITAASIKLKVLNAKQNQQLETLQKAIVHQKSYSSDNEEDNHSEEELISPTTVISKRSKKGDNSILRPNKRAKRSA